MKDFEALDFPVIDSHVHLYPDTLAEKVTPQLGAKFGNEPAFDGTVNGCISASKKGKIAASLNLPVATEERQVAHTNEFWHKYSIGKEITLTSEPQVFSLAALHPSCKNKENEIKSIASSGFTGIKFHPEYQVFRLNDAIMDEVWETMSNTNLVAYLHAGGERVFNPPYHSCPTEIAELQSRFPNLKIVAAHLGGFSMWDEAEATLMGSKVYLDLSHTFFWMKDEQILRMIKKHGSSHILFGSDAPWQDAGKVLSALLTLPLTHDELKEICFTNAVNLFRFPIAQKI